MLNSGGYYTFSSLCLELTDFKSISPVQRKFPLYFDRPMYSWHLCLRGVLELPRGVKSPCPSRKESNAWNTFHGRILYMLHIS